MTNEEAIFIIEHRDSIMDYCESKQLGDALDVSIAALKCVADIAKYLIDPDVTWRDISDDCITEIMMKHGFMK